MNGTIFTLRNLYRDGTICLEKAGIADAKLDAWYLLEYETKISRAMFLADPDKEVEKDKAEHYRKDIETRAQRIPLQHITGEQEFMGLDFKVNEHVLIPRQDTETLVEEALKKIRPGMQILDMCTGSGCILESILKFAERKGICVSGTGAVFIQGDLFENIAETYDMIVSNPPYIRTEEISSLEDEVKLHDPWIALDGKTDGLYFYRLIVKESVKHIKKGGYLLFETGFDQGKDVSALLEEQGYEEIQVKKDLAGLDRIVMGRYNKE